MTKLKILYMAVVCTAVWYALGMFGLHVLEIEHFAYVMLWGAFAGLVSNRLSEWAIGRTRITIILDTEDEEVDNAKSSK